MKTGPLLALSILLVPAVAHAHDFWFEHQGSSFVLRYGHRGGAAVAIDRTKVKSIRCLRPGMQPTDVTSSAVFAPTDVTVTSSCAVISSFHDGGYWSLTPDGEKNLPKNQVPDAVKSWESKQYAKWVDTRSPASATPVGDDLEIVPVTDLSRAKQGDKATFLVLFQGRPLSGAIASIDHRPLGETDSEGHVRLRLRADSLETISVSFRRTLATPQADTQVLEASLSFEVTK